MDSTDHLMEAGYNVTDDYGNIVFIPLTESTWPMALHFTDLWLARKRYVLRTFLDSVPEPVIS